MPRDSPSPSSSRRVNAPKWSWGADLHVFNLMYGKRLSRAEITKPFPGRTYRAVQARVQKLRREARQYFDGLAQDPRPEATEWSRGVGLWLWHRVVADGHDLDSAAVKEDFPGVPAEELKEWVRVMVEEEKRFRREGGAEAGTGNVETDEGNGPAAQRQEGIPPTSSLTPGLKVKAKDTHPTGEKLQAHAAEKVPPRDGRAPTAMEETSSSADTFPNMSPGNRGRALSKEKQAKGSNDGRALEDVQATEASAAEKEPVLTPPPPPAHISSISAAGSQGIGTDSVLSCEEMDGEMDQNGRQAATALTPTITPCFKHQQDLVMEPAENDGSADAIRHASLPRSVISVPVMGPTEDSSDNEKDQLQSERLPEFDTETENNPCTTNTCTALGDTFDSTIDGCRQSATGTEPECASTHPVGESEGTHAAAGIVSSPSNLEGPSPHAEAPQDHEPHSEQDAFYFAQVADPIGFENAVRTARRKDRGLYQVWEAPAAAPRVAIVHGPRLDCDAVARGPLIDWEEWVMVDSDRMYPTAADRARLSDLWGAWREDEVLLSMAAVQRRLDRTTESPGEAAR